MKTIVTTGPLTMEVRSAPVPVPGPQQVLVRVDAVGLCGSDYHLFDGSHPYARFPQTPGHEFTGLVEQLPPGYSGPLAKDDRVVVEPLLPCGSCIACRRGHANCCSRLEVVGAHRPGGLAELFAAEAGRVFGVGDLPALTAVLVEPVSIGMQAVHRGGVVAGDRVVVIGAGPIGLAATLCAHDLDAHVLVVDRLANRLRKAVEFGATDTVDTTHADLADAVAAFTDGEGPTVVIEATGQPALISAAVDLVAPSGTVVVVGITTAPLTIPVDVITRKELNLLGSRNNTGLFPAAIDLVRRNADVVSRLVTHTYPLERTAEAITFAMGNPQLAEKVVITIGAGR